LAIVEPEKIQAITIGISILLISIVAVISVDSTNTWLSLAPGQVQYDYWNFSNSGIFLGISSYAFESVAHIFNVRRMMQRRQDMPRLQSYTFVFVGASYYCVGAMVYLAYGRENVEHVVFGYYTEKGRSWFMQSLQYLYVCTVVFGVTFNSINLIENLEAIEWTRKWITKKGEDRISGRAVLVGRVVVIGVSMGFTLINDSFNQVLNFAGSTASPVLGYIVPVLVCWGFYKKEKWVVSPWIWWHDIAVLVSGVFVGVCGVYATFFRF
jgi:amino acid permease